MSISNTCSLGGKKGFILDQFKVRLSQLEAFSLCHLLSPPPLAFLPHQFLPWTKKLSCWVRSRARQNEGEELRVGMGRCRKEEPASAERNGGVFFFFFLTMGSLTVGAKGARAPKYRSGQSSLLLRACPPQPPTASGGARGSAAGPGSQWGGRSSTGWREQS